MLNQGSLRQIYNTSKVLNTEGITIQIKVTKRQEIDLVIQDHLQVGRHTVVTTTQISFMPVLVRGKSRNVEHHWRLNLYCSHTLPLTILGIHSQQRMPKNLQAF